MRESGLRTILRYVSRPLIQFNTPLRGTKQMGYPVIAYDQKSRMETNARYLQDNPNAAVIIEGNCDERGTNEYNLALGDRRANNAKKYLAAEGVNVSGINTLSYGEERPLNSGHDELAWSQNRRADFVRTY